MCLHSAHDDVGQAKPPGENGGLPESAGARRPGMTSDSVVVDARYKTLQALRSFDFVAGNTQARAARSLTTTNYQNFSRSLRPRDSATEA